MKAGDLVGVSSKGSRHVSLLCKVTKVGSDRTDFLVINGGWSLRIFANGHGFIIESVNSGSIGAVYVSWVGHIPPDESDHYFEFYSYAIDYMNSHKSSNVWLFARTERVRLFLDRIKRTWMAGLNEWRGTQPAMEDARVNDEIPF